MQLDELKSLVRSTAQNILMPRFREVSAKLKQDGSLVTEADLLMQEELTTQLQARWPETRLLGEEMPPQQQAALLQESTDALWILDPLDGTINFASGVPNFAVSLALLDSEGVRLGLVYDPCRDEMFSAERGKGARLNDRVLHSPRQSLALPDCVAEIDLKRLDPALRLRLVKEMPFRSQRNFGSGALDWAWLADGRYQLYLHGGQKLWDYAAGSLLLTEAGGCATNLQQQAVYNSSLDPRSVVGAVTAELQQNWLEWLSQV